MAHGDHQMGRLRKATGGDLEAAFLLYRLIFWFEHGKGRVIDGQKYVPNSYHDWVAETVSTYKRIRAAIDLLRKLNLLETTTSKFRGLPILHSRPTASALLIYDGSKDAGLDPKGLPSQGGPIAATGQATCPQGAGPMPSEGQDHIQGEKQGKKHGENNSGHHSPQEDQNLKTGYGKEHDKKMSEVEKFVKGKKFLQPDSVKALEFLWTQKVAEDTGAMVNLKAKELGQLKMFAKLCPEVKAEEVLTKVLKEWVPFIKRCQTDAGIKHVPVEPNIGFLLQYASNAVIFATPPENGPVYPFPLAETHKAAPAIVSDPIDEIVPEEYPQSLEEILAPPVMSKKASAP